MAHRLLGQAFPERDITPSRILGELTIWSDLNSCEQYHCASVPPSLLGPWGSREAQPRDFACPVPGQCHHITPRQIHVLTIRSGLLTNLTGGECVCVCGGAAPPIWKGYAILFKRKKARIKERRQRASDTCMPTMAFSTKGLGWGAAPRSGWWTSERSNQPDCNFLTNETFWSTILGNILQLILLNQDSLLWSWLLTDSRKGISSSICQHC